MHVAEGGLQLWPEGVGQDIRPLELIELSLHPGHGLVHGEEDALLGLGAVGPVGEAVLEADGGLSIQSVGKLRERTLREASAARERDNGGELGDFCNGAPDSQCSKEGRKSHGS